MRLNKIENTCSMFELTADNGQKEFRSFGGKENLVRHLWIKGQEHNSKSATLTHSKKVIMYNTNGNFAFRFYLWRTFGFKTKYSYEGNSRRVYVMFLKVN